MSKAKCIMVQGTMSGAGKSLLCAALCRIFAQDGYRVAPFKSQNMALNSFVTRNGAEMGRAQVVQAQAAGVEPDVRMNPILLKPSSDVGSQVIVNGKARGQMPAAAYFKMKRSLIPDILEAYNSLAADACQQPQAVNDVPHRRDDGQRGRALRPLVLPHHGRIHQAVDGADERAAERRAQIPEINLPDVSFQQSH